MRSSGIALLLLAALWLSARSPLSAQEMLVLDEQILGNTTLQEAGVLYAFTAESSLPHRVTVRALSAQFAPTLAIYDAEETLIARQPNPSGIAQQQLDFVPQAGSSYWLQVIGSQPGQFTLSISLIEESPDQMPQILGETSTRRGRVSPEQPMQVYTLPAENDPLWLQISADEAFGGAVASVQNQAGALVGVLSAQGRGAYFLLPAGEGIRYTLTIQHSGAARVEAYQISVLPLNFRASAQTSDLPLSTDCQVWTDNGGGVTVRAEPGADFSAIGYLLPDDLYPVIARTPNWDWWQIELLPENRGWVAEGQVIREGNCADVVTLPDSD